VQVRLRCFQVGIPIAGEIQPSPEEEDGLGGRTKVGRGKGPCGSQLKLLCTVRFGGTPGQLSLLALLSA